MSLQRNRDTLDYWLNGIPVIIPGFDGSFNAWINGIADVDRGSQAGASSPLGTTMGAAVASVNLSALAGSPVLGIGISLGSAQIKSASPLFSGGGFGITTSAVSLGAIVSVPATGTGISLGAAMVIAKPLGANAIGLAVASASLSSYPSMQLRGIGKATASVSLGYFMAYVVGPAVFGYPSIQESIPQRISMFGFIMQPILDVLRLRRVPLHYVSPPVCQPANSIASGSAFATPMIL
jgi:hypothetical protein